MIAMVPSRAALDTLQTDGVLVSSSCHWMLYLKSRGTLDWSCINARGWWTHWLSVHAPQPPNPLGFHITFFISTRTFQPSPCATAAIIYRTCWLTKDQGQMERGSDVCQEHCHHLQIHKGTRTRDLDPVKSLSSLLHINIIWTNHFQVYSCHYHWCGHPLSWTQYL